MNSGNAHAVGLHREARQDGFYTDGTGLTMRFVCALNTDQKLHGGNRGDRGIVTPEDGIHVKPAALDRD
jgi:hypothetical protein